LELLRVSWSAEFSTPIPLPDGGELHTLDDARAVLLALLPTDDDSMRRWHVAIEALLLVGGNGGPTDFARIGMMQALYPSCAPVYTDRKDRPWGRRTLTRDQ
jgi:hypothetical protein